MSEFRRKQSPLWKGTRKALIETTQKKRLPIFETMRSHCNKILGGRGYGTLDITTPEFHIDINFAADSAPCIFNLTFNNYAIHGNIPYSRKATITVNEIMDISENENELGRVSAYLNRVENIVTHEDFRL